MVGVESMRYITGALIVILIFGSLINPLAFRAEGVVEVVEIVPITAESSPEAEANVTVVATVPLSVSISAPANNATIQTGVATTFSVLASGGEPSYGFLWNFGDGTSGAGPSFTKTYTTTGPRTVTVTATDFAGTPATAQIAVNVVASVSPLTATIVSPVNNASFEINQSINFSSGASGGEPSYGFLWNFGDGTTGAGASFAKTYTAPGAKTVVLTITDFAGAPATASINLTITTSPPPPPPPPPPPDALTISDIRVTDVTSDSAIVRWTTNRPATSRVIYDTVSHPNLAGQSAPNFGYGFSTGTLDAEPKVTEHIVTVSGLTPDSTYYFRVISQ